jgi:hypothetical protein
LTAIADVVDTESQLLAFEADNVEAYKYLLRIEVILRESLRANLESELGPNWQKRLPGDLLKKVRQAQTDEYKPHFRFVRLGPLYYLTLGELLVLLQQKIGSSTATKFGGETFVKQLENLLAPRNAISHSRPVSPAGLKAIIAVSAQVETVATGALGYE